MGSDQLIGFVQRHPAWAATAISGLFAAASAFAGAFMRKLIRAAKQAAEDLKYLRDIQGTQAENHLQTIQANTSEMRDAQKETNAKLGVLIDIMKEPK